MKPSSSSAFHKPSDPRYNRPSVEGSAFTPRRSQQVPETPQRRPVRPELTERKILLSSSNTSKNSNSLYPLSLLKAHTPPLNPKRLKEDLAAAIASRSSSLTNSRAASPYGIDDELEMLLRVQQALQEDNQQEQEVVDEEKDLPVDTIPRVSILADLGKGDFGNVFLVTCNHTRFALKESRKYRSSRQENLKALEYWNDMGDHPHIVKFFRAWQEDAKLMVLMRYCEGGSLDKFPVHALTPDVLLTCFRDVCRALECVHAHNLAHMDVKPSNILVNGKGRCVLSDFDRLTLQDTLFDSTTDYRYMALEVRAMEYTVSFKADIFSLGISFLELASGIELPPNGRDWDRLRSGQNLSKQPEFVVATKQHPLLVAQGILPCMLPSRVPCKMLLESEAIKQLKQGTRLNLPPPLPLVTRGDSNSTPNNRMFSSPRSFSNLDESSLSDRFQIQALVSPRPPSSSGSGRTESPRPINFSRAADTSPVPFLMGSSSNSSNKSKQPLSKN